MNGRDKEADLSALVDEYKTLITESGIGAINEQDNGRRDRLIATLVTEGDWSSRAATALSDLMERYGSFILRNAAALSIAFGHEDGEMNF